LNLPVVIHFFNNNGGKCEHCEDTKNLLQEVAALSDGKIEMAVFDFQANRAEAEQFKIDKTPGFVILGRVGEDLIDYGIRFFGIPAGHEFTSLVNTILMVSKGVSGLTDKTKQELTNLRNPVHLQVFVTPTCPYCPRAVVLAHQMAFESQKVQADMVEAMEFNDLANQFGVLGVPHTIINNRAGEVVGAVPEDYLLDKIKQATA
jgi:glutaredoxin-like protein